MTAPDASAADNPSAAAGHADLETRIVEGVSGATVELVWDPPWSMERMSEEARLELGLL